MYYTDEALFITQQAHEFMFLTTLGHWLSQQETSYHDALVLTPLLPPCESLHKVQLNVNTAGPEIFKIEILPLWEGPIQRAKPCLKLESRGGAAPSQSTREKDTEFHQRQALRVRERINPLTAIRLGDLSIARRF